VLLHNPFYSAPPSPPTCLDDIFTAGAVKMERLEEWFWMDRGRFGKLPTEGPYNYRAVLTIMDRLLSEKPSGRKTRGRPLRIWLSDPEVRKCVLRRIRARINSLSSMPEQIKAEFLALVRRHLGDSAKK